MSALVRSDALDALDARERALLEHTSTLGIRGREVERTECERRTIEIGVSSANVRVKVRQRPGLPVSERNLSPEHADLATVACSTRMSIRELEWAAIAAALEVWRLR